MTKGSDTMFFQLSIVISTLLLIVLLCILQMKINRNHSPLLPFGDLVVP